MPTDGQPAPPNATGASAFHALAGRAALGVGAAAAIVVFLSLALDIAWLTPILKPVPVIALALWLATSAKSAPARAVIVGLAASGMGDALLDVKNAFVAGMVAFAAAHIAYMVASVHGHRRLDLALAIPFVAWGVGLFLAVRTGLGDLAVPVAIYAVVICSMMWRAAARYAQDRRRASLIGLAGALLFGLSDSLIAIKLSGVVFTGMRALILITYWAGQTGIAMSFRSAATPAPSASAAR